MKHLSKYSLFESNEFDDMKSDIIDMVQALVDDGYRITLTSTNGRVNIISGQDDNVIGEFKPVYKAGNKIKGNLSITIYSLSSDGFSNDEFSSVISEMSANIYRLKDKGWEQSDFNISKYKSTNTTKFRLTDLSYVFKKPDVITEYELPSIELIKSKFEKFGLNAEDIEYELDDNMCHVGAESYAYDGEIPEDIEDKLDRMIDELGFDYFEHEVTGTDWLSVKFWINPDRNPEND
jgi:hypothetical protein